MMNYIDNCYHITIKNAHKSCSIEKQPQKNRIQNNIFFIWFGSVLPKFAVASINYFKYLNPNFNFFIFNELNIEESKNKDVICCLNEIDTEDTFYNFYYNRFFARKYLSSNFNVRFSDVFRIYLLDTYGGIYVDCDTWPIRPFDDKLLNNIAFMPTKHDNIGDIYFIGAQKGCGKNMFSIDWLGQEYLMPTTKNIGYFDEILALKDPKYIMYRDQFFKCQLNLNQHFNDDNYYLDHFKMKSWKGK